jgi:hypothetical protein
MRGASLGSGGKTAAESAVSDRRPALGATGFEACFLSLSRPRRKPVRTPMMSLSETSRLRSQRSGQVLRSRAAFTFALISLTCDARANRPTRAGSPVGGSVPVILLERRFAGAFRRTSPGKGFALAYATGNSSNLAHLRPFHPRFLDRRSCLVRCEESDEPLGCFRCD